MTTITGRELHNEIEKIIPGFQDADLFFDNNELQLADNYYKRIEEAEKLGYLSIDSAQGHEIYYSEI